MTARGWLVSLASAAAFTACLVGAQRADAQVVRGTITQREPRAPVVGAVITLRDQSSRIMGTVLSDEEGKYEVRAPGRGGYSLEVKRIGVRRSPALQLTLAEGETQQHDLTVEAVTPVLTAVTVTGTTSCISRPGEDVATAQLWEDARAALTATVVTRRNRGQPGTVSRYVRKLDPRTLRVLDEQRNERFGGVDRAFRAVPAEELSRLGYARFGRDGTAEYFAPDAEVLLSEVFLVDHCFGVQRRDSSGTALVGLSFQPVRGRKLPDVRGVLWLEARTGELRTLEYTYTELPGPRSRVSFGGQVGFMRLPSGGWVVRQWYIRMPTYQMVRRNPDPGLPGSMPRDELVLVNVQEEGGEVQLPGEMRRSALVRGTIHDSTTGRALPGARVVVRGTSYAATADTAGQFTVTDIAEGRYALEVLHPRLDSLGTRVASNEIELTAGAERVLSLAVPSMTTVRARLCPQTPDSIVNTAGVLRVLVRDASTLGPVSRARVRVTWTRYRAAAGGAQALEDGEEVEADTAGAITVCAIPPATLVRLRPAEDATARWRDSVRVRGGGVEVHTLRVRSRAQRPLSGNTTRLAPADMRRS